MEVSQSLDGFLRQVLSGSHPPQEGPVGGPNPDERPASVRSVPRVFPHGNVKHLGVGLLADRI